MHTLTHPIPTSSNQPHTERGAYIIDLKRQYDDGTLLPQVTAEIITNLLLDALFREAPSGTTSVH